MAPELVSDPERVSEKADVWSLGMVLWEMLTRQVPFTHLTPQQIIAGLMVGNLQPEVRTCHSPDIGLSLVIVICVRMHASVAVSAVCSHSFLESLS